MKNFRFYISLYITIPFIFAGIAVLSAVVSYQLTRYQLVRGLDPFWPVTSWSLLIVIFSAISGLLIVNMMLKPMRELAKKTEKLRMIKEETGEAPVKEKKDDMERFAEVINHVTELLGQVESRELFPEIIGQSRPMRGIFNQVMKVAPTDSTVLILGETGTGKEVITKGIYNHSLRKGKPFVAINCAAIPAGLLESELFGHEKGAFTGATSRKIGKFEVANHGTIFLDEIGDMPLETQAKVLRVIQDSCFERVGGNQLIEVDVRFIAATNKNLANMVEAGEFRQDLYFRLNVFPLHMPPLRERKEDIQEMVRFFIKELGRENAVSDEAMQYMIDYDWPGNVRELQNAVESATILTKEKIEPNHLPPMIVQTRRKISKTKVVEMNENWSLDDHIKELEKEIIIDTLARAGGVQVKAAELLGISKRSLWHRVKKFEIDVTAIKDGIK